MIADLKPYPGYKDSGQEWLGQVPLHWDLKPGHAAFNKRKIPNRGLKENTVLSLSYGKIKVKPTDKQHGLVPESYETYQIVDEGNIIIRGTDLQNDHTSLRIGLVRNRGIISSAYLCLQCRDTITPEYGYQILNTFDLTKAIYRYGSGLRQNLDHGEIKRLPIFLPPVSEQAAIVRFLDHWNGRLEKAIRSKRRVIALLHEQKQAIIHRAVTRGLDDKVKLKDSGIPWLGEIPAHWEVQRLKRVCRVQGGYAFPASSFGETGTPVVRMNNLRRGVLDFGSVARIPETECVQAFALKTGDILYGLSGSIGATGSLGNYAVVTEHDLPAMLNQRIARFVPKLDKIDPNFLIQLIQSSIFYEQVLADTTGTAQFNVSTNDIENVAVGLPPISEQASLVLQVNERVEPLATAITRYEREITLLREYRTRLTADVVTGKLDVRAAAAHLPAPEQAPAEAEAEEPEEELEMEEVEG